MGIPSDDGVPGSAGRWGWKLLPIMANPEEIARKEVLPVSFIA
jgi:hypothetical protein